MSFKRQPGQGIKQSGIERGELFGEIWLSEELVMFYCGN